MMIETPCCASNQASATCGIVASFCFAILFQGLDRVE